MDAIAAAQQAEAQHAVELILQAINNHLITVADANALTPEHIGEIGILQTPQQVARYVHIVLHETPEERAQRIAQERAALQQVREQARNVVQARANARADHVANTGGRRRTRKYRKH